jgi:hypothetical protein
LAKKITFPSVKRNDLYLLISTAFAGDWVSPELTLVTSGTFLLTLFTSSLRYGPFSTATVNRLPNL